MRTTTQINQIKLKSIREKKGLTQQKLAEEAFNYPNSKSEDPTSLLRMYQKIEKTGKTSPSRAKRIADVLGYKLEDLISEEQIEQLESAKFIERHIKQRIQYLKLSDDDVNLTKIAKIFDESLDNLLSWDYPENTWCYLHTACDLVIELPQLEFLGKQFEIQNIFNCLKLNKNHFQPASLRDSFWWVYSELSESQTGFGTLVKNTSGVRILLNELKDRVNLNFCNAHVTFNLSTTENRNRSEVLVSPSNYKYLFECTPCEVHRDKGIFWKEPTLWETDVIKNELTYIAMNYSDVVIIDGVMNPPPQETLLCSIVNFKKIFNDAQEQKWIKNEEKLFTDKFKISRYLNKILEGKETSEFKFGKIDAGIELTIMKTRLDGISKLKIPFETFEIYIGCLNADKEFKKAPWTEKKRDQFIELRRTDTELVSGFSEELSYATSKKSSTSLGEQNVD